MAPLQPIATPLSPAELSYLHDSLSASPPIRPDARTPSQFRPLTSELGILPTTHGSARLVWSDGGECIVGVKTEVEKTADPTSAAWTEVSVEVAGARDDDPLGTFLGEMLAETLRVGGMQERLRIGEGWHWRCYIDILLLTPPISHPATLLSLCTHLALRDTRLPRLVSAQNEDPMFDDDWDNATPLFPDPKEVPAVTLLVCSVDQNIFFDPTREEMAVADCVLAVSLDKRGTLVGMRTLESGGLKEGGIARGVVKKIVAEAKGVRKEVFESLERAVVGG